MLTPDTFGQRQNGMFEALLKTVSQITAIIVCRDHSFLAPGQFLDQVGPGGRFHSPIEPLILAAQTIAESVVELFRKRVGPLEGRSKVGKVYGRDACRVNLQQILEGWEEFRFTGNTQPLRVMFAPIGSKPEIFADLTVYPTEGMWKFDSPKKADFPSFAYPRCDRYVISLPTQYQDCSAVKTREVKRACGVRELVIHRHDLRTLVQQSPDQMQRFQPVMIFIHTRRLVIFGLRGIFRYEPFMEF